MILHLLQMGYGIPNHSGIRSIRQDFKAQVKALARSIKKALKKAARKARTQPGQPKTISLAHLGELNGSAIDPEIAALNFVSLAEQALYERLFYSDNIKRLNTGRLPGWILNKYAHIEHGGWWANGVDPVTGEADLWGCFKPDKPRIDENKGKYQKYEHPYKATATLFAFRASQPIWKKIARRYKVAIEPSDIDPTRADNGFWKWVIEKNIPLVITEGAKKAAALLSAGFAAVGLPGIWGGYRKNEGNPILTPQLEAFATLGREIYFAFDQDTSRKTREANRQALWCTASLLEGDRSNRKTWGKAKVRVIQWSSLYKGADDLIAAKGGKAFAAQYQKALTFQEWKADGLKLLSYKPDVELDNTTKYIESLTPPPTAKLIGIKAPKGTGKTEWLVKICADAQDRGQRVIILTHREQLGRALCLRFGVDYISELKDSDTHGVFGYGLCFDSLRLNSQAKFRPEDWDNCIVILDECEQSIWHLLDAKTQVAKHRVEILRNFQQLIQQTLESEDGKIYLSDADLSDISIDYIKSLVNFPVEPWIAVKEGNPVKWHVTKWEHKGAMLGALMADIKKGGKNIVFVDGAKEKSTWGTKTLETFLKELFPSLRILRIDADSVSDPEHEAYGCIENLDKIIPNFDLILASPTIETGVSIDLTGYITAVWDFAQGVIPVGSVLQRMWRVREPVPRHFWAASYGIGTIGNGSTSPKNLMAYQEVKFKAHVAALRESEFTTDFELASDFQPQSLKTWVKMANRINYGMIDYASEITRALLEEGHTIVIGDYTQVIDDDPDAGDPEQLQELLKATKEAKYETHRNEVAGTENPSDEVHEELKKKKTHTTAERKILRKGTLSRRYSEELATNPNLVLLDDEGEHAKARLHYYLTEGREFLGDRDKQVAERMLLSGEGEIFLPDANRNLIGGKVKMMDLLGVTNLIEESGERATDDKGVLEVAAKLVQHKKEVKAVLGVSVRDKSKPFPRVQELLRRTTGLAFGAAVRQGSKGQQKRVYQPIEIPEIRQQTIVTWLEADKLRKEQEELERQQQREQQQPEQPQGLNGDLGTRLQTVSGDTVVSTEDETILVLPVLTTVSELDTKQVLTTVSELDTKLAVVTESAVGRLYKVRQFEGMFGTVVTTPSLTWLPNYRLVELPSKFYDQYIFETPEGKRISVADEDGFELMEAEPSPTLEQQVAEAFKNGVEAVKGLLGGLADEVERFSAMNAFEAAFPEQLAEMMAIAPDCWQWCWM